jgi:3-phosphoshikimate 1-carboxyvinyltransferase
MLEFHIRPGGKLVGALRVAGDKSISHRAVMLGALAQGQTRVSNFLQGEDSLATLAVFRALGVRVHGPDAGQLLIEGVGMHGLRAPSAPLDIGNSGTAMRLLCGLLCGQTFDSVLTGDASLVSRPMRRITEPLTTMGARIETTANGTAPLHLHGGLTLCGIDYALPVASAQIKSALLLAGMYAVGHTCVLEPAPTRDHTERMLESFGYPVRRDGERICIDGGGRLRACDITVPADISSAAFFIVGALLAAGSELLLEGVGVNPTRTGAIDILRAMGGRIECVNERRVGAEPVADIRVKSSELRGIRIAQDLVPLAIDEFPALFVAAALAEGETVLTGARELRIKESDRIQVMADGLRVLGAQAETTPDGMVIRGGRLGGGKVHSRGDHRVAMAFAMAGLCADADVIIDDCDNVRTSFPGFAALAGRAGLDIHEREAEDV